jgi:hypothetical protein
MPNYPPLEYPVPKIFNREDVARWEEALRQLAVVNELLGQCERCKIPVAEARADCDGLCQHFQNLIAEYSGQQSDVQAMR